MDTTLTRERAKHFGEVEAREKWLGQMWSKVDIAGVLTRKNGQKRKKVIQKSKKSK
jgi:hypothetical protein